LARKRTAYRRSTRKSRLGAELWGIALVIVVLISYAALLLDDGGGTVGRSIGAWLYRAFGAIGAHVFPLLPLSVGISLLIRGRGIPFGARAAGLALAFVLVLVLLHIIYVPPGYELLAQAVRGGGLVGGGVLFCLRKGFGFSGALLVLAGLAVATVLMLTGLSIGKALGLAVSFLRWLISAIAGQLSDFWQAATARRGRPSAGPRAGFRETEDGRLVRAEGAPPVREGRTVPGTAAAPLGAAGTALPEQAASPSGAPDRAALPGGAPVPSAEAVGLALSARAAGDAGAPAIGPAGAGQGVWDYELPSLSILRRPPRHRSGRAGPDAESRAELLEETFSSFGVGVRVMEINPGPTVTRFEVRPAPGVKVSRIESLADDIALNLAAADVRIAPIPGKGLIGVEVPNTEISVVYLREVLESSEFSRSQSRLSVAVGKDIAGQVIVGDLQRMLHLLIAGATGSGKSVCLNSLIASILFKARPDEVRFLLIDPKVVELQVFDGIPHLLAPVVTDPKKASMALKWTVKEMLDRYYRFSEVGVRNIGDYNRLMAPFSELPPEMRAAQPVEISPAGAPPGQDRWSRPGPIPHIVVVIDELADLMMVAPVEVEDSIWRLAQMARAAGIHLVVATQRPSVNVITGVIKANIPSRIAFAVASQVDSRTILDIAGAEKLLGRGDMLYYPVGASKPLRVQGALITDREVDELVRYIKAQGEPTYLESFPAPGEDERGSTQELDTRFGDALRVVFESGQASTSMLQRRLRIGYTRAARIVDMMEEMGVVGKSDGVKPRDVLMTMEQYMERYGPLDGPDKSL